jgi:hypothetical protein
MVVKAVALASPLVDKGVVLHAVLRDAIDESGWKHDAVASALDVDGPYLSKMLTAEKPIGARHLSALPDDVRRIFARRYAEGFGWIVVAPAVGDDAVRQFVSGFFGLLRERQVA